MKKIVNNADIKALLSIDPVFSFIDTTYGHPQTGQGHRDCGFFEISIQRPLILFIKQAHGFYLAGSYERHYGVIVQKLTFSDNNLALAEKLQKNMGQKAH